MSEIIFPKSQKNLKKVYNRLNSNSVAKYVNREEVLFLAIGGYNRTYDLILAMGVKPEEIATFSNLNLTSNFLMETHMKKVLYIKKINYLTSINKNVSYSKRQLDLNVADGFQESMMIYKSANRMVRKDKGFTEWIKPDVVILDDQSLNLQFDGYRFKYQTEIGFVQIRNRNVSPWSLITEIKEVEEAEQMMFALYQESGADEAEILDALNRLRQMVSRRVETEWYLKPTEFKKTVGSNELAIALRELKELNITQLKSNRKIGKENARWIIIPEQAFDFKGFAYKDETDLFEEELASESNLEEDFALEQEKILNDILFTEFPLNVKVGYVGNHMELSPNETLHSFLSDVDNIEEQRIGGVELLNGATTEEEYNYIKKHHLAYFLDGEYKDNERKDDNYLGGRRLVSIDIDEGDYTRDDIENKLEMQGLFGLVYRTAKYYYDESARWRVVLMADAPMSKEEYRNVVEGTAKMLDLQIDEASKKLSQLMGYPLSSKDVSTVIGSMVNVEQFAPKKLVFTPNNNVVEFKGSSKSLLDFNHSQARMMRDALSFGVQEGSRNETYRQIIMFLRDVQDNTELSHWHAESDQLELAVKDRMYQDGLPTKEVELICR